MKNKKQGITLVEIIVAMSLLLLTVIPLIRINVNILKANRIYSQLEEEQKLFENIVNTIKLKKYEDLRKYKGNHHYIFREGEDNKIALFPQDILSIGVHTLKKNHLNKEIQIRILEADEIDGVVLTIFMDSGKKTHQAKKLILHSK